MVKYDKELSAIYDALRTERYDRNNKTVIDQRMKKYGMNISYSEMHSDKLKHKQLQILSTKKTNGSRRGHDWDLTYGDLEWPSHCPILGMELDYFTSPRKRENSPSFDRVDNTKGYVKGNVKVISWRANRIKNDGNADEHRKIATYIDSH